MEHNFELPVRHKGQDLVFTGRIVVFTYNYQFHLIVNDANLIIEKDDEGQFRVLVPEGQEQQLPAKELVSDILEALQKIVN